MPSCRVPKSRTGGFCECPGGSGEVCLTIARHSLAHFVCMLTTAGSFQRPPSQFVSKAFSNTSSLVLWTAMNLLINLLTFFPSGLRKRVFLVHALINRAMTLGVRVVVCDDQDRVMLVRHTYVEGWHFPGGAVERNETLLEAAHKELLEECSIEALDRPKHFHTYHNPTTSRFDYVALYVCRDWSQEMPKQPDAETAETGWFTLNQRPVGTTSSTRDRLAELFDSQSVSDIW